MISFVFLIINLIISLRSNRKAERSAIASERSATAAEHSARSSAESVFIAKNSAEAGLRSALAAEKSSDSSQEANKYAKEQTEMFERELTNNHLPKLIPISKEGSINLQSHENLDYDFPTLYTNNKNTSDLFNIRVKNVFGGNAYVVSSWLEIALDDLINFYHEVESPDEYNANYRHTYEFQIPHGEEYVDDNLYTFISIDQQDVDMFELPLRQHYIENHMLIKKEEELEVFIPDYVTQIVVDNLFRLWGNPSDHDEPRYKIINLIIKYKTGFQLDSNEYRLRKYTMRLNDIFVFGENFGSSKKDGDIEFFFNLNFEYISDVKITQGKI